MGRELAGGRVFRAAEESRELADGYAFRLPAESDVLLKAAEFICLERLCCPFLVFALEVGPEGGPARLRLTGREGVMSFIREEAGDLLGGAIDWSSSSCCAIAEAASGEAEHD